MVLPLIPIILVAGTAASLAIQGVSEATRPQVIIQPRQQKSSFDFDVSSFGDVPIIVYIAILLIILLVVFK